MLDEDELRELCKQQMFYKQQEKDAVLKRTEIEARIIEMLRVDKAIHTDLEISNYKIEIKPSKTDKVNNDILEYIVNIIIDTISPIRYIKLNYIAVKG